MKKKTVNIIKIALSALLAVGLLVLLFRGVDWNAFFTGLKNCNWTYVVLSMLIGLYGFWIRSRRWRETLLPIDASISRTTAFNAVNISYLINMVIPRGGEIARCGVISGHSAKDANGQRLASFDKVLGTVIIDRVWDTLVMLLIMVLVFFSFREEWETFFNQNVESARFSSTGIVLIGLGFVALVLGLCYFLRDKNVLFAKVWGFVKGIYTGVRDGLRMQSWWKFLSLTFVLWLSYWATSALVLLSLADAGLGFENMGAVDALFLMAVGALSSVIPLPGGFGAYHYLVSMSLTAVYGIPMESGLIYAVLSHESQVLIQIIAGTASYIHETVQLKGQSD